MSTFFSGLADLPFSQFLESIFATGQQKNSVIVSISDHPIRFGEAVDTDSFVHEKNLPYIHIYIPDSFELEGKNAEELRKIVHENRNKLTSHFDLHATFLHILYGSAPINEEYGLTLFQPIPTKRHCSDAGIRPEYCMCNSYEKLSLSQKAQDHTAQFALDYINGDILSEFSDLCVNLTLTNVKRVFESFDRETSQRRWLVVFTTAPNSGMFEAIIDLDDRSTKSKPIFKKVINTSRMSYYGSQANCLKNSLRSEPYCFCKKYLQLRNFSSIYLSKFPVIIQPLILFGINGLFKLLPNLN